MKHPIQTTAALLSALVIELVTPPARAQETRPAEGSEEPAVHPPELAASVEARYPPAALEQRLEGAVVLRLTIDAAGQVTEAEIVEPAGHGFDEAAREAALGFRFRPARRGDVPTAARILHRYEFRLPPQRPAGQPSPPRETTPPEAPAPVAEQAPSAPAEVPRTAAAEAAPDEVTVVGAPPARAPGAVHVINKRTLERYGYDDPHAILQTAPGVYVRHEDGFGLRPNIGLRGAASDRSKKLTLMEDGVLFGPAPYSAPAAYYFPLMGRMAEVRVIKGPAAIGYGPQTIGGAIDLVTRPIPSESRGAVDVAGGQYAYRNLHGWAGTRSGDGRMGFVLEGIHLGNGGFKELPGGEDTGFRRNEWVLKGSYLLAPETGIHNEISLKASYSDEVSKETYLGLSDADFRRNPLRRYAASQLDEMRWHRTGVVLTHEARPAHNLEIETSLYRNVLSRSWRKVNRFAGANLFDVLTAPDTPSNAIFHGILAGELDGTSPSEALRIGPNQRNFVSQGVQTRVAWSPRTGPFAHRVEYGLRLHHDRIERRHTEDEYSVIAGEPVPTGAPTTVTASNEAWTEAVAFHASDAVTWRAFTLTPGVRVELLRSGLDDDLAQTEARGSAQVALPGMGAYLAITEALGALAGVYRGFSPPPPGNPEHLGPELSVNYEAGVRYTTQPLRAELIGYYNDYSNLTDICTLSSGCLDDELDRQFNAGAARIYGLEAHAAHEIPLGPVRLPVTGAYTLTRTEFLDTFDSDDPIFGHVEAGDELPYVPRHQAHVSIGLEAKRPGAYVAMAYVSRMREEAGREPLEEALTTDEQVVFDIGASYRVTRWLKVYSDVRNLFDSHYLVSRRPYGARPNAPRWIQLGARAEF